MQGAFAPPPPPSQPVGPLTPQANAASSSADKLLPQILGGLIEAVEAVTAAINAKPSA